MQVQRSTPLRRRFCSTNNSWPSPTVLFCGSYFQYSQSRYQESALYLVQSIAYLREGDEGELGDINLVLIIRWRIYTPLWSAVNSFNSALQRSKCVRRIGYCSPSMTDKVTGTHALASRSGRDPDLGSFLAADPRGQAQLPGSVS